MISSAEEFNSLRTSDNLDEQRRSAQEEAPIEVWHQVIKDYPNMKEWVVHNKTIPIEILEFLVHDSDAKVREVIARKRKINEKIVKTLAVDQNENVRYALMCNTKLSLEDKKQIKIDDSDWLQQQWRNTVANTSPNDK